MIRTQDLTPKVYCNQSRDFQFIGRLYDIVLNYIKTNIDLIYSIPISDNSDEQLLDLMTMTFGFKSKHNYNIQQLKSLCMCFATVLRNKGNMTSIIDACNALTGAEGLTESPTAEYDADTFTLKIFVPPTLSDVNLLNDLLDYILPAGISCQIVKRIKEEVSVESEFTTESAVEFTSIKPNIEVSQVISSLSSTAATNILKGKPQDITGAFVNTAVVYTYNYFDYSIVLREGKAYKNSTSGDELSLAGLSYDDTANAWNMTSFNFYTKNDNAIKLADATTKIIISGANNLRATTSAILCQNASSTVTISDANSGTNTLVLEATSATASKAIDASNMSLTIKNSATVEAIAPSNTEATVYAIYSNTEPAATAKNRLLEDIYWNSTQHTYTADSTSNMPITDIVLTKAADANSQGDDT